MKLCLGVGVLPPRRPGRSSQGSPQVNPGFCTAEKPRGLGPQLAKVRAQLLSHVELFVTHPMDSSPPGYLSFRQEYQSGWPFPAPRDLPNPGIEPTSLHLLHWQVDPLPLSHLGIPRFAEGSAKYFQRKEEN